MTPIQFEQKKRLLARMAATVAAGLVGKLVSSEISGTSVDLAINILKEIEQRYPNASIPEIPPGVDKQPWGADGWGA
jgi:hypothetical protein